MPQRVRMIGGKDDGLLVRRAGIGEPVGDNVEVYVVVEAGAPVDEPPLARCTVVWLDDHRAEITDLQVDPEHRGRGLARRLVREVADVLRAAGLRQLTGVRNGTCRLDFEL